MTDPKKSFLEEADGSPSMALEMAKNMIAWMEHVPDREYLKKHRTAVIMACQRVCQTLEPLAKYYLD